MPTGRTPRKRVYKKDPLLAIEVDLDEPREGVMERLRKAQVEGGLEEALLKRAVAMVPEESLSEEEVEEEAAVDTVEEDRPSSAEPSDTLPLDGEEDTYDSPPPPAVNAELDLVDAATAPSAAALGPFKPGSSAPTPAILGERDNNMRRSGRSRVR